MQDAISFNEIWGYRFIKLRLTYLSKIEYFYLKTKYSKTQNKKKLKNKIKHLFAHLLSILHKL